MKRALRLALKGRGRVSPNPRVGAVVVSRRGEIIGEGWHEDFGGPHAEVKALSRCHPTDLRDATLFVNLEPCCHQGKTPPCTEAIISAGVGRVVAAVRDPFPKVNGQGARRLTEAGVRVDMGLMALPSTYLNRGYFSYVIRGRAWCAVKVALSLDGKMASPEGFSKWITGPEARRLAHALRADHDAVLVGGGTVRRDDPALTVRHVRGPNPVRVVLSPRTGIPATSKIARSADRVRTILVTGEGVRPSRDLPPAVQVLHIPLDRRGMINPYDLLRALPKFGVVSVLIEGGSGVLSSFMQAGVVDEITVGIAPTVIGKGLAPFDGFLPPSWDSKPQYVVAGVLKCGADVIVRYLKENPPFSLD